MLVIFPFETEVYASSGLPTEFVGHPLVDIVTSRFDSTIVRDNDTVLLLPGSRSMEISRLLIPMLQTAILLYQKHPQLKFIISTPREKVKLMCQSILTNFHNANKHNKLPEIKITCGETAFWLQKAGTGLAASGTITVESAIAGLPLVVAYKLNLATLLVAGLLVKLYRGYFTMTNIIANKQVFEEFLQWRASPKNMADALTRILPGGERRTEVEQDLLNITAMLRCGSAGACAKAANSCYDFIITNRQKQLNIVESSQNKL
jgi:lipid-A-disaccharide synthase